MTRAEVDKERKATGDVCPDAEKHGRPQHETTIGAGPGGGRSALPTCIGLQIAMESQNGYSDGRNRWSSGECRLTILASQMVGCSRLQAAEGLGSSYVDGIAMRLEVFGSDGGIGDGLRTTAFLVDDDVLIDAGTGVADVPDATLNRIDHVFLTHAHVDHTALLPLMIDATWAKRGRTVTVHANEETLRALKDHVFNWKIWPDFTQIPSPDKPALRFALVELATPVKLGNRVFTPVPANHTIPTVGYRLDSGHASLVFSSDTTRCDDLWRVVNQIENLKYIIIETAFDDTSLALAELSGHLCPKLLADELKKLERAAEVFITHVKPSTHETVMREIAAQGWASPPRRLTRGQIIEF